MKKFSQFIQEQYGHQEDAGLSSQHVPHDIDDPDVQRKINAILGHTASSEYMTPEAAIGQMEAKLSLLGLAPQDGDREFSESGTIDIQMSRYGDITGKSVDTPFDEIEHESRDYTLSVRYEQLETGSYKVYANFS
jgi:hypothetical protein